MRTTPFLVLLAGSALLSVSACDEHKYDAMLAEGGAGSASAAAALSAPPAASSVAVAPPAPTYKKRSGGDCPAHPTTVDFGPADGGAAIEAEVRFKLGKDAGTLSPADLAQVKSLNLTKAQIRLHQVDPCLFPMFTSIKGVFLPPGDYDDLTPLGKLASMDALVVAL